MRYLTIQPRLLVFAAALIALATLTSGCQKLKARDNLNRGVQSFKATKYADAVEYFKKAVEFDPDFPTARLYLATAYMSQYIPGADSPENKQYAASAMDQFNKVLASQHIEAIAPQAGDPFDPTQHEALMQQPSNLPPNHVTQLLQKGYRLHDRTLRPAQVAVSKPE